MFENIKTETTENGFKKIDLEKLSKKEDNMSNNDLEEGLKMSSNEFLTNLFDPTKTNFFDPIKWLTAGRQEMPKGFFAAFKQGSTNVEKMEEEETEEGLKRNYKVSIEAPGIEDHSSIKIKVFDNDVIVSYKKKEESLDSSLSFKDSVTIKGETIKYENGVIYFECFSKPECKVYSLKKPDAKQ